MRHWSDPLIVFKALYRYTCRAIPSKIPNATVKRCAFVAKSLLHPRLSTAWFSLLSKVPLRDLVELDPSLCRRLRPPYLCADWSSREILAILKQHYDWAVHCLPPGMFQALYNAAWIEVGGTAASANFYELPLVTPRRSREQMKPNHRPKYARRYAMMDDIVAQITAHLPFQTSLNN